MPNAIDYIAWRGDLSFDISPLNEADILLFTFVGTPDLTGFVPADAGAVPLPEALDAYYAAHPETGQLGLIGSTYTLTAMERMRHAERYSGVLLTMFANKVIPEITEQFSALTLRSNGLNFVTFRGTDDSLTGWKENFLLACRTTMEAQNDAVRYLTRVANAFDGPIVVTGHSKGGNLGVWAAVNAAPEIRERIVSIVSYDGPGFNADLFGKPEYAELESRITTVVPESSVVGMILRNAGALRIVRTNTMGITGHDAFTWEMDRRGLLPAEDLSETSRAFHKTLEDVFSRMNEEELCKLVDGIFEVLDASGAANLSDFSQGTLRKLIATARSLGSEPEVYVFIKALLGGTIRRTGLQLWDKLFPSAGGELQKEG
ncbi:MAG: DUF2974 domain-containing protein [Clostridia bacterium]|nr:DUF2974 domain-containing protein [Clostridia bacterium]